MAASEIRGGGVVTPSGNYASNERELAGEIRCWACTCRRESSRAARCRRDAVSRFHQLSAHACEKKSVVTAQI